MQGEAPRARVVPSDAGTLQSAGIRDTRDRCRRPLANVRRAGQCRPAGLMSARAAAAGAILAAACSTLGLKAQIVPRQLDLLSAIELALSRHADLDAADAVTQARAGSTRQAGAAPNPRLTLQTENWRFYGNPTFSAARDLDVFAWVSVPVETAGKRARRVELAETDELIAERERQMVTWRIRQSVKTAFWQALAAEGDVAMVGATHEALRRLEDYHKARVQLGETAEVTLIRVRVEAGRVDLELARARMEASRAKLALLGAMGVPQAATDFSLLPPRQRPSHLDSGRAQALEDAAQTALGRRSEILLGRALVERARANLALQRSRARPDLTPFLGYKRTNLFNTVIGGLTVSLPVRDRNAGSIEEAAAEVRQWEAALRAAEARIRTEVAAAVERVRRHSEMLRSMEAEVLEGARDGFRIALAAYEEGGAELLDVLDAQRAQSEIGRLHSQLRFDYQLSWVGLETALGAAVLPPAPELRQPPAAPSGGAAR